MANPLTSPIALTILANSVQATTGAASATVAIPNTSDGNKARVVRISSKGNAYLQPGLSGATAAASTAILLIAGQELILNVNGMTHIAHIQETAASVVNISPLEIA